MATNNGGGVGNIFDVLDDREIARLIEQHNRYDFQECSVERRTNISQGVRNIYWFVYHQGKAIQCWRAPAAEAKAYGSLTEAIEAAMAFSMDIYEGRIKTP